MALEDPDPANKNQRKFAWMTVHEYKADKSVTYPFKDVASLNVDNEGSPWRQLRRRVCHDKAPGSIGDRSLPGSSTLFDPSGLANLGLDLLDSAVRLVEFGGRCIDG